MTFKKQEFENFLQGVNLEFYRKQFLPIKIVEMDLPKNIQAIELMYEVYWDQGNFLSFEEFYKEYLNKYSQNLEIFRKKITMCQDCFYKGLPARIYRTWASIITQIHAGYVAQSVFEGGEVKMSAELDHKGADFQVLYKNHLINYQVKKKSFSREIRQSKNATKFIDGEFIDIKYEVPNADYFDNPKKKNGEYKLPYTRFIGNTSLKRFANGFIVFTEELFLQKKNELDAQIKINSALP